MQDVPGSPFVTPAGRDPLAIVQWMPEDRRKRVLRRWLDQDEKDEANRRSNGRRGTSPSPRRGRERPVMTTTRNTDPIRKITTRNGETRYRFIVDVGNRLDGKRDQRCFTYRTMKEARAERSKIISDRSRGTLVKRTKITLGKAIDDWLDGRRNLRPSAQRSYRDSLELAKVRLGHVKIQRPHQSPPGRSGDRSAGQWPQDRQRPAEGPRPQEREPDTDPARLGAGRCDAGRPDRAQRRQDGGAAEATQTGDADLDEEPGSRVPGRCRERPTEPGLATLHLWPTVSGSTTSGTTTQAS